MKLKIDASVRVIKEDSFYKKGKLYIVKENTSEGPTNEDAIQYYRLASDTKNATTNSNWITHDKLVIVGNRELLLAGTTSDIEKLQKKVEDTQSALDSLVSVKERLEKYSSDEEELMSVIGNVRESKDSLNKIASMIKGGRISHINFELLISELF